MIEDVRFERHTTITRAIALLRNATPEDRAHYVAQTELRVELKEDPAELLDLLAAVKVDADTVAHFGAWKAAQQLLQAAGLPL